LTNDGQVIPLEKIYSNLIKLNDRIEARNIELDKLNQSILSFSKK
jgi:hypothetical protein